ncbi:MAG: glycerol kinase [Clostridia bacterium]|nr:glycerol kinase [Clostridia bacterium]
MKKYLISIDQSTSASKVMLVNAEGIIVKRFSKRHHQYYDQPGWAEHDTEEIFLNVCEGIRNVTEGIDSDDIAALAISNQRETTAFWERSTGKSVRRAIVWQDVRAAGLCRDLGAYSDLVKARTGLTLSPYYPAAKAAHALRSDEALMKRAANGEICIGTIDSFLVYRLTGGRRFSTDVSNASRTQLFDIRRLCFDKELCDTFGIPFACLAEPIPSDGDFGATAAPGIPAGIPITGVLGDSHASLFGHGCVKEGMVKTSYGTGSSVMLNTGEIPCESGRGLSTSIAYGWQGRTDYVLEGNITHSGDTLVWLCDKAEMASDPAEVEKLASSVPDTDGVYLVPAFSGMGAPYFDESARAAFIGMNRSTTRAHMVRAALESMAYQNADVIFAMAELAGRNVQVLHADGGGCKNELLMSLQADLLGCEVWASDESELSALGAAYMAGFKTGLFNPETVKRGCSRSYLPQSDENRRTALMQGWRGAVQRILHQ